jgi:hypothetical protein
MTMDGSLGTESKSKKAANAAAAKAAPAYDPDKDHISTLLLELGQATAIVDLLFMVACGKGGDSIDGMRKCTLESSLHTVLERLRAVENAADAILDEKTALSSATG